jgi:hypothetical protein
MSDSDSDTVEGPIMIAATNMLRPPPVVIGSLNDRLTLPRTIKLTTLVALIVGMTIGFLIGFVLFGAGLDALIYGPLFGGGLGFLAVNYSPMHGESLGRWLGLVTRVAVAHKVQVDGHRARLYVGIAPLHRVAAGRIRIVPGSVPVEADAWDDRGLPRLTERQREQLVGASVPRRPTPSGGLRASTSLTSQTPTRGRRRSRARRHGTGGDGSRRG